jgi:hypothetical protein
MRIIAGCVIALATAAGIGAAHDNSAPKHAAAQLRTITPPSQSGPIGQSELASQISRIVLGKAIGSVLFVITVFRHVHQSDVRGIHRSDRAPLLIVLVDEMFGSELVPLHSDFDRLGVRSK